MYLTILQFVCHVDS